MRADPNPTAAATVHWTVTFSEAVTGVSRANFSLAGSGFSGTPGGVGVVSGSGAVWTVAANTDRPTTTNAASEALRLSSASRIEDPAGNALNSSWLPFTGQAYTVDRRPPTLVSIERADPDPVDATAGSVHWTVRFSEPVTGVTKSDFGLKTSGFSSLPIITGVSGSGALWTVAATTDTATLHGPGSEQLRLADTGGIKDLRGNGPTSCGQPFKGQTYTVYKHPLPHR